MPAYRYGPLRLDSRFALPELQPSVGIPRGAAWSIREARSGDRTRRFQTLHAWSFPDGRPWANVAAAGGLYRVSFGRIASFEIDPVERVIVVRRVPGVPPATVRHLLLDQVLPLVLAERECVVVHASAVDFFGQAVGFAGGSGVGKSTIAAAYAQRGHAIVTDDCLLIDSLETAPAAVPVYAGLRLWPDALAAFLPRARSGALVPHRAPKRRIGREPSCVRFRRTRLPVRALFVLGRERGPVRIARLRGHEAFAGVVRCTFTLEIERGTTGVLEKIGRLLDRVPVYALRVPRGLHAVADLPLTITEAIGG